MRFRYPLIATLVALAAVTAGSQAANGEDSGSSYSLPSGKVTPVKSKSLPSPKNATRIEASGTRIHNGNDNISGALNLTSSVNGSVCRAPSTCFLHDDNVGATTETGENTNCPPAFDSTVWYAFQVSKQGLLDVIINNTTPDGSGAGQFVPVLGIYNGSTGSGFCGAASTTTTNFGDTFVAGPGTTLGTTVFVQVGATLTGSAGGQFDLNLSWDPDSDGDGIVDTSDRCDGARGPSSLRGCPDSDGDAIPDIDDSCDTLRGPKSLGGCPDSDGDGLIDPVDACDGESTVGKVDRNHNGCPDYKALPDLRVSGGGVIRGNKVIGARVKLKFRAKLPRGTKLKIRCKPRKNCKLRRRGKFSRRIKFVSFRTKRTKITIKATKRGYVSKVFTFKVGYKTVGGGGRNVIITTPKKRCIPATGGRTRRCTSSLLLR